MPQSEFENDAKSDPRSTRSSGYVLSVSGLVLGSTAEARDTNEPVSFESKTGTLTMIIGPVGSGKSTLLKAILGEWVPEKGAIEIDTPVIGYCSQSPWLQNSSIRDNIVGAGTYDLDWYHSVVQICALEQDFAQMPLNDLTIVGSRGVVLSGGQKHRIVSISTHLDSIFVLIYQKALARALYSRCSILVLDDFLSSLDRKTQGIVAHQLFSKNGHIQLRQCTMILVTHNSKFFGFEWICFS
jgi:ABC-type bacteriocin/lantibiotic exporter with double-glycine peptidase domain